MDNYRLLDYKGHKKQLLNIKQLEKEGKVLVICDIPERSKDDLGIIVVERRVIEEMVADSSEICPVFRCNNKKSRYDWVCDEHSDEHKGDLKRSIRKFVVQEIVKRNGCKTASDKKRIKLILKEIKYDVVQKIKDGFNREQVFEKICCDYSVLPKPKIKEAYHKGLERLWESGWVPFNIWNDLIDYSEKKLSEGKTIQDLFKLVPERIPIQYRKEINTERTVSNIIGTIKRYRENQPFNLVII